MAAPIITTVIFDLGNVLIDFDHRIAARRMSRYSGRPPEEIFDLFFNSELTGGFEAGLINPQDFFLRVSRMLGLSISYGQFLPIWNEIFFLTPKNLAVYKLASALKKSCRMGLLSNINILHMEYLKKHFRVFDAFHEIIASCDTGLVKPDPRIYQKALTVLGAQAAEVFYTDDRPELVASAKGLGIHAFVFQGAEQLESDLAQAGITASAYVP